MRTDEVPGAAGKTWVMPLMIERDTEQVSLPCLYMRGGSSRGGFFLDSDLPQDWSERAALLLAAYGSPDSRQIDGIGGADPLTSKAAIVAVSERDDADLDYTFCQVDISRAKVSTGGNCGNMLSAVAPFAVLRGLIPAQEGENCVRIYTTNTKQVVTARFEVKGGAPRVNGGTIVPGVPGTGATVSVDFGDCAGSVSGKLLPTGNPVDTIEVAGRRIEVSLVDAATPFVYVMAADIDANAGASAQAIQANADLMQQLEQVRGWAAVALGLVDDPKDAVRVTPNIPRVIMIAGPQSYPAGESTVAQEDVDLVVRQLAMQKPHKALAVTGAVCTAVACQVPGTVVNRCLRPGATGDIRLGHASGVLSVSAEVQLESGEVVIRRAAVNRTARLIMAGELFVPREKLEAVKKVLEP
ncbi:methylitaconate delta2-delta3-isomerase [Alcaligenaceae bacterium]|nr:methylitaconate delta2-delta3-isomerase [Alcaligenaceae bacterium]